MSAASALVGTRVRRIDAPADALFALTLHGPDVHGVLVIGIASQARGLGWLEQRPSGRSNNPFALHCKSKLDGARLASIAWFGAETLRMTFERGGERFTFEAELRGANGDARLYGADGALLSSLRPGSASATQLVHGDAPEAQARDRELDLDWHRLHAEGERLLQAHARAELEHHKRELARALRTEARREQRKLTAIESDALRAAEVPALRQRAALVLSNLHALADDCTEASVLDYATDPPAEVVLRFDPTLGPKREAEAWFRRARKLERGAVIANERAAASRTRLASLQALADRVDAVAERDDAVAERVDFDRIAKEARAFGIGPAEVDASPDTARALPAAGRLPYREFVGSGGRPILVGRGAADNDRLTLDHAKPHDLWLHARDGSGAHVVVPLKRDEACPPELLCDAATLTAHFSHARGQGRADVIYTQRRYVRKPRKSAVGSVQLMREKVFALRLEPERLRRLLAAEKPRRG